MPAQGTWLECNGQSTAAYPALASIVGANVPDYRGIFLRGLGSQTSNHYNTVTHSSAGLGVLQGDAIRNISGYFGGQFTFFNGAMYQLAVSFWNRGSTPSNQAIWFEGNLGFDASRVVPTAEENRPINRAVRYLIKAA